MSTETDRWRGIRHLLACRSDHCCEVCGVRLGARNEGTAHHRNPRGMGGTRDPHIDDLCNLLILCGGRLGGVRGCHGYIESHSTLAYAAGWKVRDGFDPADVPVVLYSGRRVRLHRTQQFYIDPPDGPEYALTLPAPGLPGRHR